MELSDSDNEFIPAPVRKSKRKKLACVNGGVSGPRELEDCKAAVTKATSFSTTCTSTAFESGQPQTSATLPRVSATNSSISGRHKVEVS